MVWIGRVRSEKFRHDFVAWTFALVAPVRPILQKFRPFSCTQLMQKFVPRSRIWTCHNKLARSTPLDTNSCFGVFHTIWVHLGQFGCLTKLGAKLAKLVQKVVPWSRIGIFHNECTRSTPLDPILTFWCISYYLAAFRTLWLAYETRCKTGRTNAKVRATKSRRIFSQRTHPIHPIGP